ncbi:condensation domain-containing protein, partial [Citreicoccus inhibens]|uniref:condensation domain-containing protein n=1 Tax=Citreicoccus inhibens TaxID=2849499 RepID=UPI001F1795FB
MVPSWVVVLEALPLTPNGKVDRRALPEPEAQPSAESLRNHVPPRTATELRVAELFERVLGIERVGANGSFFELGGHSLLATQLVSRVRQAFEIELPLRELFTSPTVAALSERIERAARVRGKTHVPALQPRVSRVASPPLSFAQQRLWFLERLSPGTAFYNLPIAVDLLGPLDAVALRRAFEAVVLRHEALRTTFQVENGQPVQHIESAPGIAFSVRNLESHPTSEREAAAQDCVEREAQLPFDLEHGPLIRMTLLRLSEQVHVLVLVTHHIVSDGWSNEIFVRELTAFYEAFVDGHASPLPALSLQYADFSTWQRDWLQGEPLEAQLAHWRQQLKGAPRALELPTDRPRPAAQTFRGANIHVAWPKSLWREMEGLGRREGATVFMVLLAAYQALLSRYTGQRDVSVGSPIAGRTHAETEGVIGFFVNTLVLRARLSRDMTFRELLAQVREVTLGAYAHQDVPFEKLVEELQPERDLSRSPLFQVSLTLQNTPAAQVHLRQGLRIQGRATSEHTSKFEMSLLVEELPERVAVVANYNSDLFDAETVEGLLGHLRVLVEAAVARPEEKVRELPLMGEEERRRVVEEWSGKRV